MAYKNEPKDKFIECDCCGFKTDCHLFERQQIGRDLAEEDRCWYLCVLCSHTLISNSVDYPGQYQGVWLGQASAYHTNMILNGIAEIRADIIELRKSIALVHHRIDEKDKN